MKSPLQRFLIRLQHEYVTNRTTFVLRTTILALIVVIYVSQRTFWTPDMLF
ncbi:hypothetical protein H7Y40_00350, partial [Pedobacter sp.]|nr:hypothetical protein [Candidatus Saccharibacteria bacterium]